MNFFKISLLILLATNHFLLASLKNEEECKSLAEEVMSLVEDGSYEEAFKKASVHWPIPEKEILEVVKHTETQLNSVATRFGSLLGSEFIREDKVGKSYIRYIYIQKFENHATRWLFVFYKPKGEWVVNGIKWDDSSELLFDMPSIELEVDK